MSLATQEALTQRLLHGVNQVLQDQIPIAVAAVLMRSGESLAAEVRAELDATVRRCVADALNTAAPSTEP